MSAFDKKGEESVNEVSATINVTGNATNQKSKIVLRIPSMMQTLIPSTPTAYLWRIGSIIKVCIAQGKLRPIRVQLRITTHLQKNVRCLVTM